MKNLTLGLLLGILIGAYGAVLWKDHREIAADKALNNGLGQMNDWLSTRASRNEALPRDQEELCRQAGASDLSPAAVGLLLSGQVGYLRPSDREWLLLIYRRDCRTRFLRGRIEAGAVRVERCTERGTYTYTP